MGKNRVARHMKSMGLRCKTLKKFVATTDSKHKEPVAENILNRAFSVPSPNTVWVSDITYVKVGSKWYYLTVFIDLFSRIIVGWDLSESLERHSMIRAFQKALFRRRPGEGLLVPTGVFNIPAPISGTCLRKGTSFTQGELLGARSLPLGYNAVAESFFHTIKTQLIYHRRFQRKCQLEQALFNYIEIYYNRRRRHSTNGYQSPAKYEFEWGKMQKVA